MDEPTSALDPIATLKHRRADDHPEERVTIIIVTHNMQQAARISDDCAFLLMGEDRAGELIEFDTTEKIFNNPNRPAHARLHPRSLRLIRSRLRGVTNYLQRVLRGDNVATNFGRSRRRRWRR